MFAGPIVVRELLTAPRHPQHFGVRAGYIAALCVLIFTGAQSTFGNIPMRHVGDIARFGTFIFSLLCFVQLSLVIAASLLLSAGSVAQEKDRRTLILLLMTDLRPTELVIGKSLASVLPVLVMIAISFPVLCFLRMLGGITLTQIIWFEVICTAAALAAASWGTLVGYWREKTFQILAVTLMGAGLFLGLAETGLALTGSESALGLVFESCNPFRGLMNILSPLSRSGSAGGQWGAANVLMIVTCALWAYTCARVRIWNPSRFLYQHAEQAAPAQPTLASEPVVHVPAPTLEPEDGIASSVTAETAPLEGQNKIGQTVPPTVGADAIGEAGLEASETAIAARAVWKFPIIWREICTQAYGRKVGIIKLAYFAFTVFCILWMNRVPADAPLIFGMISAEGFAFVMLSLIGLILVNAQSVTSFTSERDGQTLELLLVTEVTANEFIFGKLGGVLFNTKEVIAVPLLFAVSMAIQGSVDLESLIFILLSNLTLVGFAAMLGLHAGISFDLSKSAILNSLGTMFFLFVGVFVCMMLIVEARASFGLQLTPFLVFIVGGGFWLALSMTHKNPSPALWSSSLILPFITFYAITSFLLGDSLFVFLAIACAYGFTTTAMLIPAVSAFDVALGRTTMNQS